MLLLFKYHEKYLLTKQSPVKHEVKILVPQFFLQTYLHNILIM